MPQMDLMPFDSTSSNVQIMDAIRGVVSLDYQDRVPAATKAGIQASINAMWNYVPSRNEFIDALVNVIGAQIIRYNTWTNPLAKYKRGLLNWGETIEEVAVGLLNAYHYSAEREYLERDIFGREPNEVQSRFHKVNRRDFYKLTVNRDQLQRAFSNEGGLSQLLTGLMASVNTSDNVDEFNLMTSLFRTYYDNNGFFKVNTPDLSTGSATGDDAKQFLVRARELSQSLTFMSREYNAAKMPVVAKPEQLELIMTPRANAVLDVEALAAAFNENRMAISSRITIVPEANINIPGAQAILTTKDFFIVGDQLMEMQQSNNPVALHQNYFWHHWQTISASPFVPAILLTTEADTPITVRSTPVSGISTLTLIDETGVTVTTAERGGVYEVQGSAITTPAGGVNNGLTLTIEGNKSARTRITQSGVLVIGYDDAATDITVHAVATDDNTFTKDLTIPLTGEYVEGSIGQTVNSGTTTP